MASQQYGSSTPYTLYYNRFSIRSIMILYLIEIRGKPKDPQSAMDFSHKEIDIFHEEQLSEQYMFEVNPNGQVPVLGSDTAFDFPLAQTLAISEYITKRYPELVPSEYSEETSSLLHQMHEINFFTLSFKGSPQLASGIPDGVLRRMEKKDISDRYRKALENKLENLKRDEVDALGPTNVTAEKQKVRDLFDALSKLLNPASGPWILGRKRPGELDAHLVALIARLLDVGDHDLVPDPLMEYGAMAMKTPAWQSVMEGRSTMYDGSSG